MTGQKRAHSAGGDAAAQRKKQKLKAHYKAQASAKDKGRRTLSVGDRGVLVVVDGSGKFKGLYEAIDILNHFCDELYPVQAPEASASESTPAEDGADEPDDIGAALAKEIEKEKSGKRPWRVQPHDTNVKGLHFIGVPDNVDPALLVHKVLEELADTKEARSRFVIRMLPVLATCKATKDDITTATREAANPYFFGENQQPLKFAVQYKSRYNDNLERLDIVEAVAGVVGGNDDVTHSVDLDNPDLMVLVEVVNKVCCLGVARDFHKFRRYNLHEILKAAQGTDKQAKKAEASMPEGGAE